MDGLNFLFGLNFVKPTDENNQSNDVEIVSEDSGKTVKMIETGIADFLVDIQTNAETGQRKIYQYR
jgi:ABC-type tungstate transport system permease subunit